MDRVERVVLGAIGAATVGLLGLLAFWARPRPAPNIGAALMAAFDEDEEADYEYLGEFDEMEGKIDDTCIWCGKPFPAVTDETDEAMKKAVNALRHEWIMTSFGDKRTAILACCQVHMENYIMCGRTTPSEEKAE